MSKFKVMTWSAKRFPGGMCMALLTDNSGKPLTVYGVWTGRTEADAAAAAKRDNYGQASRGLGGK